MSETASEIAVLRAALVAAEARASAAEGALVEAKDELSQVQALVSASEDMIRHLRLQIAKLRREQYGHSAERHARLIEQLEMQLEDIETDIADDRAKAEAMAPRTTVAAFERRRPARKPFPEHLPRERVVVEAPTSCSCCGSGRIVKMGEDVTETLEVIPRQWKVIQTVREKISQPPAPFHPTPRGWAGPNLLAMVLFEIEPWERQWSERPWRGGQHQPLNRQAERYAKEGVEISVSTLADQVGACSVALQPIHNLIRTHVLGAERLHADDTTVPLMAKGGTQTARLWTYLRDDRPFAGGAPPAALYYFSTDRRMEHPTRHLAGWTGILQADAYGGYNGVYDAARKPAPVFSALCWSHARRKFFELADIKATARKGRPIAEDISPIALEAVKRIDAIFDAEREITGMGAEARHNTRQRLVRPMVEDLHNWMRTERAHMSKHNPVAKAINYMLDDDGRWDAFTRILDDGRICLTNNAAERALRGIALGRKAWLFAGSPRGGERAAFMYSLIVTAKMNDVDPQAWLADVLARLPDMPVSRLPELLPWKWKGSTITNRLLK